MRTRLITLTVLALAACAAAFVAPAGADDELSPSELLARYQPVTVFDATEAFAPTSVDDFLADADLQQDVGGAFLPVEMPAAGLPVHGDGWRLDHRGCSPAGGLAAVACYRAAEHGPSVAYGRHEVRAGTIVLQYWFFYNDNFWSLQYPPSGFAWQAHEGDWEVVTVVLDEQQNPVRAAYSQHCTGERRSWANVQKAGTHPVVYVATGSHANLFAPGVHPISLSCYPPQIRAILQQNGITPLDFLAVQGRTLGPGTTEIEPIHDNSPRWLRFPGTWGEAQFIRIPPPVGPGTVPFGTSPTGPQDHDVWVDPLGTIAGYPGS